MPNSDISPAPSVKSINRQILAIAVPAIIANITTPLLSIVDVTIVGHLGSDAFLAAIAIGGSMFNMLYWLFGFLRMGTSGLTAQAFGAGDRKAQSLTLYRSLAIAFAAGTVMILLQTPIADLTLLFMDADPHTSALARHYFSICVSGAPAALGTFALSGWFLGMQNSRAQMWISLVINVSNIALSLCMVYLLHLGITGVACGTLAAQWTGLGTALVLLRRYGVGRPDWARIPDMQELRRFFAVNSDIFLRTVCLVCVTVWFTRAGARQSTAMLDVNTLLLQLFMLFSYFMDGFAFAGEALCGRYTGAHNNRDLRRCIRALLTWGAALAALFTAMYALAGTDFIRMMSSHTSVTDLSAEYMAWAVVVPIAGFLSFTWDGIMIGTTMTRTMLATMSAATAVYFAIYFVWFPTLGNHALWLAFVSYLLVRGLAQTILWKIISKRHNRS